MIGSQWFRQVDEVAEERPASSFRVRNVVRDERIRLSGEDSSSRMKGLCSPIKALTTLRW